jgi:hypothetical protein
MTTKKIEEIPFGDDKKGRRTTAKAGEKAKTRATTKARATADSLRE